MYWSGGYDSKLMRAAIAAPTPELLTDGQGEISAIVLDASAIYWDDWQTGTIMMLPKSGKLLTTTRSATDVRETARWARLAERSQCRSVRPATRCLDPNRESTGMRERSTAEEAFDERNRERGHLLHWIVT